MKKTKRNKSPLKLITQVKKKDNPTLKRTKHFPKRYANSHSAHENVLNVTQAITSHLLRELKLNMLSND